MEQHLSDATGSAAVSSGRPGRTVGGPIAETETRDNGKLLREMRGQLGAIPDWLRYFGGLADKVEGRVLPLTDPRVLNYTRPEPLGVVAVIVPWNSPVFTALMALFLPLPPATPS